MLEDWITIEQAARLSGYHPEYIRKLAREGKIKASKFGSVWAINQTDLREYLKDAKDKGGYYGPRKDY